ncbi:hypothetical protein [Halostella litorea]|uniref:hypothetical protein n=1 Tax=Halostella litorea TaxID=2528831 RepID=UPI001092F62B|nr:hypothetical protein [Halostella litorea]
MADDEHDDLDRIELGNGDSLAERIAEIGCDDASACSTDELRERLGLSPSYSPPPDAVLDENQTLEDL